MRGLALIRPHQKKWLTGLILGWIATVSAPMQAQFETRGRFPVQDYPLSIAVGDFNRDGKLDVAAVAGDGGKLAVLLGNGDGTFRPSAYYQISQQEESLRFVATADLRKNGTLDLVVADYLDENISVLLGNGDGTFQAPTVFSTSLGGPVFVAVGDFGGSFPDLVVIDGLYISVMIGNGDGTFQLPINTQTTYGATAVGIGDYDHDGKTDLAVAEFFGGIDEVVVLLGNGDGTFSPADTYPVGPSPESVAVADFRGNGKLDLAVGDFQGLGIDVLLGHGNGTFAPAVGYPAFIPQWLVAADVNGDGKPDLIVAGGGAVSGAASVLLGNGDGTFQPEVNYPIGNESTFVAVGDFNGDHKLDMVVADALDNALITLLNTGTVTFAPTTPVTFPDQLIGTTSAAQSVTMTNSGTSSLRISSVRATGPFAASSTCGRSLAPGAQCQLSATFSPKTEGTQTGTISIVDSASSKPQVIELTGAGTVVKFVPASVTFAAQKVGTTSAPQAVQLTNVGSKALTVSKILIGREFRNFSETNTCGSAIGAGASCTISVTFAPVRAGTLTAVMYVYDNGGGSPQPVILTGTGN